MANIMSFAVFWVAKLLVFNRMFRTELEEFDEHLTHEEEEEEATEDEASTRATPQWPPASAGDDVSP